MACGMARAKAVDEAHRKAFDCWLHEGCNAGMQYMQRYSDLRSDPRLMHPGTKTVICFALPYRQDSRNPFIASYALGPDYHDVMRRLLAEMHIEGRICTDTAPILEKYWAVQCGIGWIGRNHQLVISGKGSSFFLGEILSAEEADIYDMPHQGSCGDCHLCESACPVHALRSDGMLDARLCISYLTIENKGDISVPAPDGKMFYGCDRCLRACPHHKGAPVQTHFPMKPELADMTEDDWKHLSEEQYRQLFSNSAVKRVKYQGLCRNIQWAL